MKRRNVGTITQKHLKSVLFYKMGIFTWREGRRKQLVAGTMHKAGYRQIQIEGTCYMEHKLAWLYVHGHFPDGYLTHKDGNRLNNRIENLVIK